jgi:hypothetical protein
LNDHGEDPEAGRRLQATADAIVARERGRMAFAEATANMQRAAELVEPTADVQARARAIRQASQVRRAGDEVDVDEVDARDLASKVEHLRSALETRTVIANAVGLLMAGGRTRDEAFDLLRRASQRMNRKLYLIAAEFVERHEQRVNAERQGEADGDHSGIGSRWNQIDA